MKIAIVTGASSGMGAEFVKRLAEENAFDEIWLVARRRERLERLAAEVGRARVIPLDLTDPESVPALRNAVEAAGAEIGCLVLAAGFGKFGDHTEVSGEDVAGMIDLDFKAVVLCCALLAPFAVRGSRIVILSSVSAYMPLVNFSVYAASKAAVLSYSYALRRELAGRGVRVTAVAPGWVDTEFAAVAENGGRVHGPKRLRPMTTADRVVRKALRDSRRNRPVSICGLYWKAVHVLSALVPRRLTAFVWAKMQRSPSERNIRVIK